MQRCRRTSVTGLTLNLALAMTMTLAVTTSELLQLLECLGV